MLSTRVVTALAGIPLLLVMAFWGGPVLLAGLGMVAVLGMKEYQAISAAAGLKPLGVMGYLAVLGWLGVYFAVAMGSLAGLDEAVNVAAFGMLAMMAGLMLWRYPRYALADLAVAYTGAFYIGLLGYLFLLRYLPGQGWRLLLFTLVLTWAGDTGAYFTGKQWGRHQLAAAISPKKTWEGLAGGVACSVAAGLIISSGAGLTRGDAAMLGVAAALAGLFGDLTESAFKRTAGVKDSGRLLPGHGGILDRFDSLLFVGPVVYYFLRWFIIE